MGDDLEDRLRADGRAFESLLSLTPAKFYFGEDTSDQWQRKKQSKEERIAARREKLRPSNIKSAKDVMDERERKRKRDEEREEAKKRQRVDDDESRTMDPKKQEPKTKLEKRKERRERKKGKEARQKVKDKEKQKRRREKYKGEAKAVKNKSANGDEGDAEDLSKENDMEGIEIPEMVEVIAQDHNDVSSSVSSPEPKSGLSHTSEQQPASSTSSPPPSIAPGIDSPLDTLDLSGSFSKHTSEKVIRPTSISIPKPDHEALKARLQARIEGLRAARKADGPDGRPARSRAELIEARRKKQESKKLLKKEQRQAAKEDEQQAATEAELALLRGSGSPMTNGSDIFSPSIDQSYSFGRIGFGDGSLVGSNGKVVDAIKRKGRMDPRTALMAAEKKRERLSGLDEEKREDIESKDLWLNAKKKIHGERVQDDLSLLKKTLKNKEKSKSKSEREWKAREEGVQKSKEAKQKKREENLAKRRDEKGNKGKKKPKGLSKKKLKNKAFGNLK